MPIKYISLGAKALTLTLVVSSLFIFSPSPVAKAATPNSATVLGMSLDSEYAIFDDNLNMIAEIPYSTLPLFVGYANDFVVSVLDFDNNGTQDLLTMGGDYNSMGFDHITCYSAMYSGGYTISNHNKTIYVNTSSSDYSTFEAGAYQIAIPESLLGFEYKATGDFDNNGKADFLWRDCTTGQNAITLMDTNNTLSEPIALPSRPVSDGFTITGASDFNGDGNLDLLWNKANNYGQYLTDIWFMNGTQVVSQQSAPLNQDTCAFIVGAGEFSGDNKSDLIWINYCSMEYIIWNMDGKDMISTSSKTFSVNLGNGQIPEGDITDAFLTGMSL